MQEKKPYLTPKQLLRLLPNIIRVPRHHLPNLITKVLIADMPSFKYTPARSIHWYTSERSTCVDCEKVMARAILIAVLCDERRSTRSIGSTSG